ncbi:MAG: TPM domain-containing protein [Prevotella sp.]|nr:TPM domain-containing protein [Prevotella sp.]
MTTFIYFLGFIAILVAGGYGVTRKWDYTPGTALMKKSSDINQLTSRYNDAIRALEDAYDMENNQSGWNLTSSYNRRQYSKRYQALAREYNSKRRQIINVWEKMNPAWSKARKAWGWVFVIGVTSAVTCCTASLPFEEETPATTVMSETGTRYWNAETIPIPYLQDATQYVSNPDHVLDQNTVDQMNITLKQLETEMDIQSVVIVVNHIENDDPFRFAQDVGNKYGVGRNDRGLMIVVGYLDHSINMSPGRGLEGDLTDVECHRLQQEYVVPAMRAEMPDSGMLYLTKAIYATMQKKEMPEMSSLSSQSDEIDEEIITTVGMYMLFFIAWCVFFLKLNNKYQWLSTLNMATIKSNPFYEESSNGGTFYSGGGGRGSSWGDGGFGGGSFGGGSFGGGGATSRW